jgi:hypothetical protein
VEFRLVVEAPRRRAEGGVAAAPEDGRDVGRQTAPVGSGVREGQDVVGRQRRGDVAGDEAVAAEDR